MFSFTHTYILMKVYKTDSKDPNSIPSEILLGNILPDVIADFESRKGIDSSGLHLQIHDRIRSSEQIEYDLESGLELGFAIHVMSDNYSRVGSYWRSNKNNGVGFLKKLESLVELGELSERLGDRINVFRRRVLQSALDILVLRNSYDDILYSISKATGFLEVNKKEIVEKISLMTGISKDDIKDKIQKFLFKYSSNIKFQSLEPIRAYAAIRIIEDMGDINGTQKFLDQVKNHYAFGIVIENLKLLKLWNSYLKKTAVNILTSPVKVY